MSDISTPFLQLIKMMLDKELDLLPNDFVWANLALACHWHYLTTKKWVDTIPNPAALSQRKGGHITTVF